MADQKISTLTAATLPLTGAELLPIVQGGATVKALVSSMVSAEAKTAPAISAGTLTLDCSLSTVKVVALNAAITTLTFSNVPASGTAYAMTLALVADGTARSVTWGTAVKWPSGSAPTLTSTNGKTDIVTLTTWDGGTTWYAGIAGQNY